MPWKKSIIEMINIMIPAKRIQPAQRSPISAVLVAVAMQSSFRDVDLRFGTCGRVPAPRSRPRDPTGSPGKDDLPHAEIVIRRGARHGGRRNHPLSVGWRGPAKPGRCPSERKAKRSKREDGRAWDRTRDLPRVKRALSR